mmetsp:Transcript_13828/g.43769  ORF Transcript_13828/g.43769 Transcript_13828/m.43769 type:complete len:216 (+) Transcript_13828:1527-2174(+)
MPDSNSPVPAVVNEIRHHSRHPALVVGLLRPRDGEGPVARLLHSCKVPPARDPVRDEHERPHHLDYAEAVGGVELVELAHEPPQPQQARALDDRHRGEICPPLRDEPVEGHGGHEVDGEPALEVCVGDDPLPPDEDPILHHGGAEVEADVKDEHDVHPDRDAGEDVRGRGVVPAVGLLEEAGLVGHLDRHVNDEEHDRHVPPVLEPAVGVDDAGP